MLLGRSVGVMVLRGRGGDGGGWLLGVIRWGVKWKSSQ